MSFEYIIEKDSSTKKLTKEEEVKLVKDISSTFVELNSKRVSNLKMASDLANEIFFKNDFKSLTNKTQNGKPKLKCVKHLCFIRP